MQNSQPTDDIVQLSRGRRKTTDGHNTTGCRKNSAIQTLARCGYYQGNHPKGPETPYWTWVVPHV